MSGVMVVNAVPEMGMLSPQFEDKIYSLMANAIFTRSEFVRRALDPRRNLNDECGYPDRIDIWKYWDQYSRNPIAARVVQVMPKETWQVEPTVYEDDDPNSLTPFERDWKVLGQSLQMSGGAIPGSPAQRSSYVPTSGSPIWEALKRLDVISGLGRYGVLLMGLDDGLPLDQPAQYRAGQRLTFLRTFPEHLAQIVGADNNPASPRYLQPEFYNVAMGEPAYDRQTVGTLGPVRVATKKVHWTRTLHVADNSMTGDLYGVPRMQEPFNRLLDLDKLYGGSAEMYYKGAFPGLSIETLPQLGGEPELDLTGMRRMIEQYMNGLQRYMALTGMTARSLAPQVVDPSPQIMVQIQAVCILLGIPLRIFMGSERGQLASGQDDASWNDRIRTRARDHATPRLVVPFTERVIQLGCVAQPKQYHVWWPDLTTQTGQEKSQIAFQRTQALVQYVKGEGWRVVPPLDFLIRILGFEEVEAIAILKNAKESGLFDLTSVQTGGRQNDYTHLGGGSGGVNPPAAA